jgi:hypothetical protein
MYIKNKTANRANIPSKTTKTITAAGTLSIQIVRIRSFFILLRFAELELSVTVPLLGFQVSAGAVSEPPGQTMTFVLEKVVPLTSPKLIFPTGLKNPSLKISEKKVRTLPLKLTRSKTGL